MEGEKKEGIKEITKGVSFEQTKSATEYGVPNPPPPKKYKCSVHGEILGSDILWKIDGDTRKPFCGRCQNPVVPL